jgi:hypothetical protein
VPSSATDNKSNKKVSSRFLSIECKNETDAALLRKKLITAYTLLPTKVDPVVGAFIPFDAKYTDLEIFRRLVRRQNRYLADHQNIPSNGLDPTILSYVLDNGNDVSDEIKVNAQVFRIDASDSRDHIGRYNFSTSSEHYKHAVQWIDIELPKLLAQVPEAHRGEFEGCFEHVSPRGQSSRSVNSGNSSTRSYLSVLTSFYGADDSEDDAPPQTFRKNRPPPQLTFNFDAELDFPTLPIPAPAAPGPIPAYRSPNPSTKSASSSITMSEINAVRSEMQS